MFGPQKGAGPEAIARFEVGLTRLADRLGGDPAAAGMGAAGGTGYGLVAGWGARLERGASAIAELSGLTAALAWSDLVITGEGRLDATSFWGKVVGEVQARAKRAGVPVQVVAGQIDPGLGPDAGLSLTALAGSVDASLASPERWLEEAGAHLARALGGDA